MVAALAALGGCAAVVASGAAAQTPAWSSPQLVAGSVDSFPVLAFSSTGQGVAAWGAWPASGPPAARWTAAARSTGTDGFGDAGLLAQGFRIARLDLYGEDRLLAGGETATGPAILDGTLAAPGRPRALVRSGGAGLLDLAVNARGDAAVLFARCGRECATHDVLLRVRRRGRRFAAAQVVQRRQIGWAADAAIDAAGGVTVAWEHGARVGDERHLILARRRSTGGRLSRTERLAATTAGVGRLQVATTTGGTTVVGWLAQSVSEGDANGPAQIAVVVARRNRRFGSPQRLARVDVTGTDRYVSQAGLRLVPTNAAGLLAAWTDFAADRFVVRVGELDGVRISGARVVSDPTQDTVLSDAAIGPRGEAAVLGLQGIRGALGPGPVQVVAFVRGPLRGTGAFSGAEAVSTGQGHVEAARVAFNPVARRPVSVWRDLPNHAIGTSARSPVE